MRLGLSNTMDTCKAVEVSLSRFTFEAVNVAGDQNPVCFILPDTANQETNPNIEGDQT